MTFQAFIQINEARIEAPHPYDQVFMLIRVKQGVLQRAFVIDGDADHRQTGFTAALHHLPDQFGVHRNKALYTGSNGEQGFFDLGVDMARQTFSGLEGDYTMSVAIALPGVGE